MDKIEKKSKKKVVVVLKNKSKKLRPKSNDKGKIMYHQKGGDDDNFVVASYSNYKFPTDKLVSKRLEELNLDSDENKYDLEQINKFFDKCLKFLTDDDFATLYLKSNFQITDPNTSEKSIKTSADTLLHFKSLILLEMCRRLLDNVINPNAIFTKKTNDTTQLTFNTLGPAFDAIEDLEDNLKYLIAMFTYKGFYNKIIDGGNEDDNIKEFSMLIDDKRVPCCLYILNYLINEFTTENKALVEIGQIQKKASSPGDSDLFIAKHHFVKLADGNDTAKETEFNTRLAFVSALKPALELINKKFTYTYDLAKASNIIEHILFRDSPA
jgi:hypothetical protein